MIWILTITKAVIDYFDDLKAEKKEKQNDKT